MSVLASLVLFLIRVVTIASMIGGALTPPIAFHLGNPSPPASSSIANTAGDTPAAENPLLAFMKNSLAQDESATPSPTSAGPTETPSPTLEGTSTETPDPTPTETPTLPPTPTSTATPLPTLTSNLLTSEFAGEIELQLRLTPPKIKPDGKVTLQWEVIGYDFPKRAKDSDPEIFLVLSLPEGFNLPARRAQAQEFATFSRQGEAIRIPIRASKGRVHIQISEAVEGPFEIKAHLEAGFESFAQASLRIEDDRAVRITTRGGQARGLGDQVVVTFPGEALDREIDVRVKPAQTSDELLQSLSGNPFEIVAYAVPTEQAQPTGEATVEPIPTRAASDENLDESLSPNPLAEGENNTASAEPTPTPVGTQEPGRADEVSRFDSPITISIHYNPDLLDGDEQSLSMYYFDESLGTWKPLPSEVDLENHILTAMTDHLTLFDFSAQNLDLTRLSSVESFQTSLFTGAATYSQSFWVPQGPGSLQPELTLSYSSQTIDSASSFTQGSWVGMGWSLDTPFIERNTHDTIDFSGDDIFSININGISSVLLPGEDGFYHTLDDIFWKIRYDAENDLWIASDKTGNEYLFGNQATYPEVSDCTVTNRTWRWSLSTVENIYGRKLTYEYQTDSRKFWLNDTCDPEPKTDYTIQLAVYPKQITYPNDRYRIVFDTSTGREDYRFEWTDNQSRTRYQLSYLDQIRVLQDADGDGSFETVVRKYAFGYETQAEKRVFPGLIWPYSCEASGCSEGHGALTLARVMEYGRGGTAKLPDQVFRYEANHLASGENGYGGRVDFEYSEWHDQDGANPVALNCEDLSFEGWTNASCSNNTSSGLLSIYAGENQSVHYGLLRSFQPGTAYHLEATAVGCSGCSATIQLGISNGHTELLLASVALPDDSTPVAVEGTILLPADTSFAIPFIRGANWSLSSYKITALPTHYRVVQRAVSDGLGGSPDTFTYEYADPASNDAAHSAAAAEPEATRYVEPYSEFRGHAQVIERGPGGRQTTTSFYQTDNLKGRISGVSTGYSDGRILTGSSTTYGWQPMPASPDDAVFPHNKDGLRFSDLVLGWTFISEGISRIYEGDSSFVGNRTQYEYRPEDQGGNQYGNQTRSIISFWDNGWIDYRATKTRFFPRDDGTTYLAALPGIVEVFDCPGGLCDYDDGDLISVQQYLYDGNASFSASPSSGELSGNRVWVSGTPGSRLYADSLYRYDSWGNTTEREAFTGYGRETSLASSGSRISQTVYDTEYHTYTLQQVNDLGQSWSWEYDYALGLPLRESDPNQAETIASYDDFGRMKTLRRPGDETGSPTVQVTYHDDERPFWIEIKQRTSDSNGIAQRYIYDGLGQLVQQQAGGANLVSGIRDVVTYMEYDAYGNSTRTSVPYAVSPWNGSGDPYRTPDAGQPSTRTTYDALNRTLTITFMDNSQQVYMYDDLVTRSIDAMDRITQTFQDGRGRIIRVIPPDGPDLSYNYDSLDRLVSVTTGGAAYTIAYDVGGRKTALSDADMGQWGYQYDALGNLLQQTDARGCSVTFRYDALNRLTRKEYSGLGSCAQTVPVTFSYDGHSGSNHGIGQRTGMLDGTGRTDWVYDARGRLIREQKTIQGGGLFVTEWGYNSADQLTWVRYPGGRSGEPGEKVDYTYHPQMQLDTVSSGRDVYVSSTTYDAAGRLNAISLGNDLIELASTYYPWTYTGGSGRLQQTTAGTSGDATRYQDLRYAYDLVGNIQTIDDWAAGSPQQQAFAYDALDRLVTASANGGYTGLYSESYSYDAQSGVLSTKAGVSYGYNDPDHVHAVTHLDGSLRYVYDENGNQIIRSLPAGSDSLLYDAENRLIQVSRGGAVIAEYEYDGDGSLVRKVADGTTTLYVGELVEVRLDGEILVLPSPTPLATSIPTATSMAATWTATLAPTATQAATPIPSKTPTATLTSTSTATATLATGTGLLGEYFDNDDFTYLKVVRTDPTVNFSWGTGSPASGVGSDQFSVRWTGTVQPQFSETYRFYVEHDDEAKLWIDNQLIVNAGCCGEHSGTIALQAGVKYSLRLEFREFSGGAYAKLRWSSASQPKTIIPQSQLFPAYATPTAVPSDGEGLLGQYYNNDDFTDLVYERQDANVNFSWGTGAPVSGMAADHFSVRWTGYVLPRFSETYRFYVEHDDETKLWINNKLVVNVGCCGEHSGTIALQEGVKYAIRLEFKEFSSGAFAKLRWSSTTQPKEFIPQAQLFPPSPSAPIPPGSGDGLTGEYYDNEDFTYLKVVRTDPTLNFSWGTGSPASGVGSDHFSVRWTGFVQPRFSETYRFYVEHDDTAKLWIDGQLLVNSGCCGEHSGTINLQAGVKYSLRLEYQEASSGAYAKLRWRSPSQYKQIVPQSQLYSASPTLTPTATVASGSGLLGEYYDNDDFTYLKVVRQDSNVNFNWGTGAPASGVGADNFSVRWTGYVQPRFSETYRFYLEHDDEAKLWINDQLILNAGCCGEHSGTIALQEGVKYALRLEFREFSSGAFAKLSWSSTTQPKEIIPQSQLFPASATPTATLASGEGLRGDYYDNDDFTNLTVTRNDAQVNFSWGTSAPASGMGGDHFSVRWTGFVQPRFTETYRFYVEHDDEARLWIGNQLVVNAGCCGEHSGTIALQEGVKYALQLEFREFSIGAYAKLRWSSTSQPKEILPQSQLFLPDMPTETPTPTATPTSTPSVMPSVTPTPTSTPGATAVVGAGEVWTFYYFASSRRVAYRVEGDPIAEKNGLFFILSDHLGSTALTLGSGGQVASELRYYPWGDLRYEQGQSSINFRFTDQMQSQEIGLYHYDSRWYDPVLGRFISPDNLAAGADNPQGLDRYAYVNNNPLKFTDPSGHYICEDAFNCRPPKRTSIVPTDPSERNEYYAKRTKSLRLSHLPVEAESIEWIQWFGPTQYAYDNGAGWNYTKYCQGNHCGLDLGAPYGTDVTASTYAWVAYAGGEHVILYTAGYFTGDPYWKINFQHTTTHEVKAGDWVSPGTVISHVGNPGGTPSSGNSHIHLEISWDPDPSNEYKSRFDNPMLYFDERDRQVLENVALNQLLTDDFRGVQFIYEGYNSLTVDYIERGAGTLKKEP